MRDYVGANLARHKTQKYVKLMNEFPATASGKIQKYKLREMAAKEIEDDSTVVQDRKNYHTDKGQNCSNNAKERKNILL